MMKVATIVPSCVSVPPAVAQLDREVWLLGAFRPRAFLQRTTARGGNPVDESPTLKNPEVARFLETFYVSLPSPPSTSPPLRDRVAVTVLTLDIVVFSTGRVVPSGRLSWAKTNG